MKKTVKKKPQPLQVTPPDNTKSVLDYRLLFLLLVSAIFYFNTIFNEYALDDFLVISKNTYTQKGIAGIPDLVSKTSYFGFFKNNNEEATLRYRPLVMISYALECQFFKNESTRMLLSHSCNIIIFLITVFVLFKLFTNHLFKKNSELVFLAVLIFAIHPIHTESIANLKGRDELMSFLFGILSALYLFKYLADNKKTTLLLSVLFFLAGLLSKENTISFLFVLPVMAYFFSTVEIKRILKLMVPFLAIALGYIFLRFSITGWSHNPTPTILNNPFIDAGLNEKYATIVFCLGFYLKLLFFPHPLSYDYTFNQMPLVKFDDWHVWLAFACNLILLVLAVTGLKRKSILSFGILFYYLTIFLVTNIPVNLGALIGERLLYTPSLGFSIVVAFLLNQLSELFSKTKLLSGNYIKSGFLFLLILVCGYKTISRNRDWKNNFTLMTTDVSSSPGSMKANDAAAIAYILATDDTTLNEEKRIDYLNKAIRYDLKATEIMPSFTDVYFNLGASFSRLEMPDSAELYWNIARKQKPEHPKLTEFDNVLGILFLKRGLKKAIDHNMDGCLADMAKSVLYAPRNAEAWYNYGGALFSTGRYNEAVSAFQKTLEISPDHQQAKQGLNSLLSRK